MKNKKQQIFSVVQTVDKLKDFRVYIWEEDLEEANHLRHFDEINQIYAKRKETIECVFADA